MNQLFETMSDIIKKTNSVIKTSILEENRGVAFYFPDGSADFLFRSEIPLLMALYPDENDANQLVDCVLRHHYALSHFRNIPKRSYFIARNKNRIPNVRKEKVIGDIATALYDLCRYRGRNYAIYRLGTGTWNTDPIVCKTAWANTFRLLRPVVVSGEKKVPLLGKGISLSRDASQILQTCGSIMLTDQTGLAGNPLLFNQNLAALIADVWSSGTFYFSYEGERLLHVSRDEEPMRILRSRLEDEDPARCDLSGNIFCYYHGNYLTM